MKAENRFFLFIMVLILGCTVILTACSDPALQSSKNTCISKTNGEADVHTPPFQRVEERFFILKQPGQNSNYTVTYYEPDGCITRIATIGRYAQPLIIKNGLIYYQNCNVIYAVDFSGETTSQIALDDTILRGWLLYSDENNLYGVATSRGTGDAEDAEISFSVDLGLTQVIYLPMLPEINHNPGA